MERLGLLGAVVILGYMGQRSPNHLSVDVPFTIPIQERRTGRPRGVTMLCDSCVSSLGCYFPALSAFWIVKVQLWHCIPCPAFACGTRPWQIPVTIIFTHYSLYSVLPAPAFRCIGAKLSALEQLLPGRTYTTSSDHTCRWPWMKAWATSDGARALNELPVCSLKYKTLIHQRPECPKNLRNVSNIGHKFLISCWAPWECV